MRRIEQRSRRVESIKGIGAGYVYTEQNPKVYKALYDDNETLREHIPVEHRFFICEFPDNSEAVNVSVIGGSASVISAKEFLKEISEAENNSSFRLFDLNGFEITDENISDYIGLHHD